MDKIYISKKWLQRSVLSLLIISMGIIWYHHAQTEKKTEESFWEEWEEVQESSLINEIAPEEESKEPKVGVHVTGAVCLPDQIYYLEEGARVGEAIEAAGGATEAADLSQLNLADYIRDGQRIYVPEKGEIWQEGENSRQENAQNLLTNINLATKIELLSLPGIGETYAQRILDYREEHGPFESIEDIMKVKGIGESKFAELKDRITVQ